MTFAHRRHAGEVLAARRATRDVDVVLALPRGGVPVTVPVGSQQACEALSTIDDAAQVAL